MADVTVVSRVRVKDVPVAATVKSKPGRVGDIPNIPKPSLKIIITKKNKKLKTIIK